MVDFHTHLLPAMDDGSQSAEETERMLSCMQEQGISTVVATPHFDLRSETVNQFLERREAAVSKVKLPSGMKLLCGAEVLYCGLPLHRYEDIEKLCIQNTQYILIENMCFEWDEAFLQDMRGLMMECGLIPILAHIERYTFSKKNLAYIRQMREEGAVLQVNTSSFLKRKTARHARKLLKKEGVHLIGSDCHNLENRSPNLKAAMDEIEKKMGETFTLRLTKNAERMFS